MGDGVLDDERVEPVGMCGCEPESRRAAVVLHDQGVAAQAEDLGDTADDGGQVVEGVGKLGLAGRVAVPEPGEHAGATRRNGPTSRSSSGCHIREEEGNPCSSRIAGASGGPASR